MTGRWPLKKCPEYVVGAFPHIASLQDARYGEDFFVVVQEMATGDSIWDVEVTYREADNTLHQALAPTHEGVWEIPSGSDPLAGVTWYGNEAFITTEQTPRVHLLGTYVFQF